MTEGDRSLRFWTYGGFWRRCVALVVDTILLSILGGPLHLATTILLWPGAWIGSFDHGAMWSGAVVAWGYFVGFTTLWQATPGKRIMNLQVTDVQGSPPSLRHVLLREVVGRPVSVLLLGFGYVIADMTREKQALHDLIAATRVVTVARPDEIDAGLRRIERILALGSAVALDRLAGIPTPLCVALADEYVRRHPEEAVVTNGTLRLTGRVELI